LLVLTTAACGSQKFSSPSSFTPSAAHANAGGAFAAHYAGKFSMTSCTASANGHFTFSGKGSGSFIHLSSEKGHMVDKRFSVRCVWSGTATLVSRRQPGSSVTVTLGLNDGSRTNPCNNSVGFVVKSGTGKFAKASGYGTVTFTCSGTNAYTDQWSGTLTF
jgi:hypothetical protein